MLKMLQRSRLRESTNRPDHESHSRCSLPVPSACVRPRQLRAGRRALYLQHVHDMLPCPLCVIQRYCLPGDRRWPAWSARFSRRVRRRGPRVAAAGGAGRSGRRRQAPVRAGPSRLLAAGSIRWKRSLNKIPTADHAALAVPGRRPVRERADRLFGLSIPQWSAVWFAGLPLALVWRAGAPRADEASRAPAPYRPRRRCRLHGLPRRSRLRHSKPASCCATRWA